MQSLYNKLEHLENLIMAMRVYAKANENKIRSTEDAYNDYISRLVSTSSEQIAAQNV